MKKRARILLAVINLIIIAAASFSFKMQHRFGGRYFCASIYMGTWFITKYTTINPTTTLYCTTTSTAPKTSLFRVAQNL